MERTGDVDGGGASTEMAWFTFGLSVVRDEAGAIVAYFNPASETTGRVEAERALTAARMAAEHSEARLREVFRQAPSFFSVVRGPRHVLEHANDAYHRLVGKGPEILGRPVFEALPEASGQGFEALLAATTDDEVAALLRDGAEIRRVVAERHGAQRYRLGWPATALRREFAVLREEIARVLASRRGAPLDWSEAGAAQAMLERLLHQAAETGVRSIEQEAATDGRRTAAMAPARAGGPADEDR